MIDVTKDNVNKIKLRRPVLYRHRVRADEKDFKQRQREGLIRAATKQACFL